MNDDALTPEDGQAVIDIAQSAQDRVTAALRTLIRLSVTIGVTVVLLLVGALATGVASLESNTAKVNSIEKTVTQHDQTLTQTLAAACILIESTRGDAHPLPVPSGCAAAIKKIKR